MPTTSDNKLDLLYKKFIGIPLSNPSGAAASEAAGSSKLKIIPSLQIFSQSIPSTAPTDLSNVTFTPTNSGGTKQVSTGNTHIAKYTLLGLSEVQPQISYRYDNPASGTNLTSPAIPGNYDITTSTYSITLYGNDGSTVINPSTYPWVFDTDSGYVSFIDPTNLLPTALAPPKITFWRYEGTFGLGSSGSSSSGDVNGDLSLNGRLVVSGSDSSFNGNLYIGGTLTAPNLTVNNNFSTLTVEHLSPFDYTIDANLFVLETAVATGTNPTLNGTTVLYSTIDCSFSGRLNVGSDLTINRRLFAKEDSSFNGNLSVGGTLTASNLSVNNNFSTLTVEHLSPFDYTVDNNLFVLETAVATGTNPTLNGTNVLYSAIDCSFSGRLNVGSDMTFNGNLFVALDTSLNGNLSVGKDLTINGRLLVNSGDVSFNNGNLYVAGNVGIGMVANSGYELDVAGDVRNNGKLVVLGDASLNGNLFVALDTSLNGNLNIGKDLTIKGRLNVQNYTNTNIINTTVNNYQLIVSEDLSLNGRLVVGSDITTNKRLFTVGDSSLNGNLFVNGDVSFNKRLFIGGGLNMMPFATTTSYTASFLNDNPLFLRGDLNHGLAYGNYYNSIFRSGIDGPFLFGYSGGALGSYNSGTTNTALSWSNDKSITLNGKINIKGSNYIDFGSDQTKEGSAGQMGYGTHSYGGSLDIVGAGTTVTSRTIRMWDNLIINGTHACTNISCNNVTISKAGQCLFVSNSSGGDTAQILKPNSSANYCLRLDNTGGVSQGHFIVFFNNGSQVGRLQSTNSSGMSLSQGSDYRLKNNITDLTTAEYIIENLKPVSFEFKIEPGVIVGGFIAHEVQEFIPRCIDGIKDGVDASGNPYYQGIDIVPMIPYMVKMLQIQNKRISDLQLENSNLKQQNVLFNEKIKNIEDRLSKNAL